MYDATPIVADGFERQLLPTTQTAAARVREGAMRLPEELWTAAGHVGDIKRGLYKPSVVAPDDVLPFLIYELGLEPVTPWVPDLRRVLADGRRWQRIRGTPASIAQALAWIDAPLDALEEHPDGTWWDLFQLAMADDRLRGLLPIERVIALTRLSKPAHTDVIRVYSPSADRRVHMLDGSVLDGPTQLDDWSGIWLRRDWPKIALGSRLTGRLAVANFSTLATSRRRSATTFRGPSDHRVDIHRLDGPEPITGLFSAGGTKRRSTSGAPVRLDAGWSSGSWLDKPWGFAAEPTPSATAVPGLTSVRSGTRRRATAAAPVAALSFAGLAAHGGRRRMTGEMSSGWASAGWSSGPFGAGTVKFDVSQNLTRSPSPYGWSDATGWADGQHLG